MSLRVRRHNENGPLFPLPKIRAQIDWEFFCLFVCLFPFLIVVVVIVFVLFFGGGVNSFILKLFVKCFMQRIRQHWTTCLTCKVIQN